jgi:hypothetical protein
MNTWSPETYCNLFRFPQLDRRGDSVAGTVTRAGQSGVRIRAEGEVLLVC